MTPPFKHYPLAIRILLLFSMFLFNMGVVSFIALFFAQKIFNLENAQQVLEGTLTNSNEINAFLFIQGLSSLGGFVLTAMMFAVLESGEFKHYLRIKNLPSVKMIVLAVASILVAQFFIEYLVELNQKIPLPSALSFLNDYQKKAEEIINAMMNFKDIGHLIFVSIVVALIPAIGEEFFFRGILLGDLLKGKIRPAIAIPVTGLIFAVSHMEYDNTIAIWALGSFLGYLYYVSGSLWLPIAAHFTNNFLAVLMKYFFNLGMISEDVANAKTPLYATIVSLLIFAVFISLFNKWKNPATFVEVEETEPLNENPSI
ncbi:MAG: CPBP family intramembrane metalloprotease [Bacteroidetes bacterium]|nr:CPBP family intramembrane metalloprotease [Bacteroidota bacterium]